MALAPRIDSIQAGQNLAINGNFDFFQRGVGPITTNNNATTFLADRFRVQNTLTSNVQIERSTDVPTLAQSGFQSQYSLKLTNSASPSSPTTGYVNIRYVVEGYDYQPLHGKPFRVQFWVKTSLAGTYSACFKNNAGTRTYITTCVVSAANTWEKKVVDLTGDTAGTWLFDANAGLRLILNLQAPSAAKNASQNTWLEDSGNAFFAATTQTDWAVTASATFFIAQVSIIPGSYSADADIPFKRAGRTISDELAMCQRYCPAYYFNSVSGPFGQFRNTTDGSIQIPFMVSARAVPTSISLVGGGTYLATVSNGSTTSISNPTFNSANLQGCKVDFTGGTGGTSGGASQLVNTTAGAAIIFEGVEL